MAAQYKEGARVRLLLHGEHEMTGEVVARNQASLQSVNDEGEVVEHATQEDWLIRFDDGTERWVNRDSIEGRA